MHVEKKAFLYYSLNRFKMAFKKNEHSTDLRSLVVQRFLNGDSYAVIGKKALIPRRTIQSIITKYNKTNKKSQVENEKLQILLIELFSVR